MAKSKHKSKYTSKVGLAPGTIVYVGSREKEKSKIEIYDYTASDIHIRKELNIEDCIPYIKKDTITWINITGLNDVAFIKQLGESFQLHSLLLEDIVNTKQRPKIDEYSNYILLVLKMLYYDDKGELIIEHLSLIMGKNYVMTLQEELPGDVFEPIRNRLKDEKSRVRQKGTDYLMFVLIDAIVDNYFLIIEAIGEKTIALEQKLFTDEDDNIIREIQALKREILKIRRSIYPLREVISGLEKIDASIIQADTFPYIRDLYDHTISIIESIESFRDGISGLMDMHMNNMSNKMNKVMKVLTIIATLFIPLTFVAGVYGMNFKYFPELNWKYGYLDFWILIVILVSVMMYFFKKKKWF